MIAQTQKSRIPLDFVLAEKVKPVRSGNYYIPRNILELAGATCSSYLKMIAKPGVIEITVKNHEIEGLGKRKLAFASIENAVSAKLFEAAGINHNEAEFRVKPGKIEIREAS